MAKKHLRHAKNTQTSPKTSQTLPKTFQTLPKTPQTLPKTLQTWPKTAQTLPKTPQTLPSISTSISIRKVIMIYHGSPYEMQTDMQGERQRMTTAEKESLVGSPAERRAHQRFLFCCAHPLPGVPLTFLFAFHTEIHGKSLIRPLDMSVCISYGDSW